MLQVSQFLEMVNDHETKAHVELLVGWVSLEASLDQLASLMDVAGIGLALVCVAVCNHHMVCQMDHTWLGEMGMIQEEGNENSRELEVLNYQTGQ